MASLESMPQETTLPAVLMLKAFPSAGFQYRQKRFGPWWGTFIWTFRLVDTDALQKRHWDLHAWSDKEVQQWKDSHLSSCNAIAIAAGRHKALVGLDDFLPLQLESSIATLKAVALPRHLLDLSVVLFMIGIGLYEFPGYKTQPNRPRGMAYRKVLIVFIATTLAYLIYHALILLGAVYDTKKKDDEFGTSSLRGAWGESPELRDLRGGLNKVHKDLSPELQLVSVLEGVTRELRELRRARQPGPAKQL
ncbi:hypothetical protein Q7P35_000952 [Cladosporium inversicolor]